MTVASVLSLGRRFGVGCGNRQLSLWNVVVREIRYPSPGEILLEEFLKPMGLTQYRLAKEIGVPQRRIGEIIAGKRSITADTGSTPGSSGTSASQGSSVSCAHSISLPVDPGQWRS
jgi:hypothetical protein